MKRLIEIAEYLASPAAPLAEVLERFNALDHPFQLVVDEDHRLIGTLTDGDVRRSILKGVPLDGPVARSMHETPVIGRTGADTANLELLQSVPFLPLVDDSGRVTEVLLAATVLPFPDAALIMAGGKGSRLGRRTRTTPKPLLPVGGKPILDHILHKLEAAGVRRVWIAVHHLADRIEDFVGARTSKADIGLIRESQPLGTAGALGLVPETLDEPILVLNGDVLTKTDFVALDAFHRQHGYDATIAVARHSVEIPYGIVRHDDGGAFRGIDEKPVLRNFVAAGIYYLSPAFVGLVAPNEATSMPALLNDGHRIGMRIGLFPIHEYWADIGRPEDLDAAEAHHRDAT